MSQSVTSVCPSEPRQRTLQGVAVDRFIQKKGSTLMMNLLGKEMPLSRTKGRLCSNNGGRGARLYHRPRQHHRLKIFPRTPGNNDANHPYGKPMDRVAKTIATWGRHRIFYERKGCRHLRSRTDLYSYQSTGGLYSPVVQWGSIRDRSVPPASSLRYRMTWPIPSRDRRCCLYGSGRIHLSRLRSSKELSQSPGFVRPRFMRGLAFAEQSRVGKPDELQNVISTSIIRIFPSSAWCKAKEERRTR